MRINVRPALTQLGFIRLVAHPAFSRDALSPLNAVALLARNVGHRTHDFWDEPLPPVHAVGGFDARLRGCRQVTDGYLIALAAHHKGIFATFDRGAQDLAEGRFQSAVELVPTR
jgi:predicted nucleic acid-binding protein